MPTLLIVTTSKILYHTLRRKLNMQYNIHSCDTGSDAVSLLEELLPEVLIINLPLPQADGLTVLRRSSHKPSAILALTNFVSDDVLREAATVGVSAVMTVPCTVNAILETLDRIIEQTPAQS